MQNLVSHLGAVRFPIAGRPVANCGLYGCRLRDEEKLNVSKHNVRIIVSFIHNLFGFLHRGIVCHSEGFIVFSTHL